MRYIISIFLLMISYGILKAEYVPVNMEPYVITCNTTTFTDSGITGSKNIYAYNPGAYDIKIASAAIVNIANRFTVKAASYLPFPIEYNGVIYALATDTNSVILNLLVTK